jgi:Tol biopolymer transport system component/DNA-binding winged helix-turn-helix (wHTH) protein
MSKQLNGLYEFGEFRLDAAERLLLHDDKPVPLTPKAFETLLVLIQNSGHLVEKDDLMKQVWADAFVEEANLARNIWALRKALADDEGEHRYIETVPKLGYRFVAPVRELTSDAVDVMVQRRVRARVVIEEHSRDPRTTAANAVDISPINLTARDSKTRAFKIAGLLVGVALALVVTTGIGWRLLASRKLANPNPPPFDVSNVVQRSITSSGNVLYSIISPDGQFIAYAAVDEEDRTTVWLEHAGSKQAHELFPPSFDRIGLAAISHDNNWIYYSRLRSDQPLKESALYRMPLFGGPSRKIVETIHLFVALSPDDRRILLHRFKEPDGIDVISVNADDGGDEQLIASGKSSADYMGTRWSPDGSKLLFFRMEQKPEGTYWSVHEMPSQGGPSKIILPPRQRRIWFVEWVDQGRGIVMNATDPATKIPQLYYVSYPSGEIHRITNDLVSYTTISVGGETVLAGKVERQSKIFLTDWPGPGVGRKTIDRDMSEGFAWTPDNKIVYDTPDEGRIHLWIAHSDGPEALQLSPDSAEEKQPDVSPDGKLIAFLSRRSGNVALWVMDVEGRNAKQLTATGLPWRPKISPDGQSIYFLLDRGGRTVLARISITGGEPVVVADEVNSESDFDISPDGRLLAYSIADKDRNRKRVVVRPISGDASPSYFDIEPHYFLRWTPDGEDLAYSDAPADKKLGAALWLQPITGGPPREVLEVAPDLLYWAAWSRDGKQLALSHGRFARDIVLLSRNRAGS